MDRWLIRFDASARRGGSDAGISAALRARELDPGVCATLVVADRYPNYSICGLPFYLSGEVEDCRDLAHRTTEEIETEGVLILADHTALSVDPKDRTVRVANRDGETKDLPYDRLVATDVRPATTLAEGAGMRTGVPQLHASGLRPLGRRAGCRQGLGAGDPPPYPSVRRLAAEFVGTFLLVFAGPWAVIVNEVSGESAQARRKGCLTARRWRSVQLSRAKLLSGRAKWPSWVRVPLLHARREPETRDFGRALDPRKDRGPARTGPVLDFVAILV